MKLGINSRRTGNLLSRAGNLLRLQGIARRVGRSFLHRGCGHGLILRYISKFESSLGSQAVGSLAYYFSVGENPRHSRDLGWRTPVSDRRFMAFRSLRGGFRAPVSERHFPISISACRRPVRYLTETGFGVPFGCDVTDDAGINRRCYNESPMLCSCSIQDKPIVRSCSAHE
jgi:hypothetical protein